MLRIRAESLRATGVSLAQPAGLVQAQLRHGDNPFSPSAVIVNRRIPFYGQAQDYPDFTMQFKGQAAIFAMRRLPGWSRKLSASGDRGSA